MIPYNRAADVSVHPHPQEHDATVGGCAKRPKDDSCTVRQRARQQTWRGERASSTEEGNTYEPNTQYWREPSMSSPNRTTAGMQSEPAGGKPSRAADQTCLDPSPSHLATETTHSDPSAGFVTATDIDSHAAIGPVTDVPSAFSETSNTGSVPMKTIKSKRRATPWSDHLGKIAHEVVSSSKLTAETHDDPVMAVDDGNGRMKNKRRTSSFLRMSSKKTATETHDDPVMVDGAPSGLPKVRRRTSAFFWSDKLGRMAQEVLSKMTTDPNSFPSQMLGEAQALPMPARLRDASTQTSGHQHNPVVSERTQQQQRQMIAPVRYFRPEMPKQVVP